MYIVMREIIVHVVQPTNWVDIFISIGSIIISTVAVFISIITYKSQKKHNKNSVRPILNVILGDYEDNLYVRIDNNGVGPAIVSSINCICNYFDEPISANSLSGILPFKAIIKGAFKKTVDMHIVTDFVEDIAGRTISPGGHIMLLQIENPSMEQLLVFRNLLNKCHIEVEYTDIYESKYWKCKRLLNFFGRNLTNKHQIQYLMEDDKKGTDK